MVPESVPCVIAGQLVTELDVKLINALHKHAKPITVYQLNTLYQLYDSDSRIYNRLYELEKAGLTHVDKSFATDTKIRKLEWSLTDKTLQHFHVATLKERTTAALEAALTAMDVARDAIMAIDVTRAKLYKVNPQTDSLLDGAAAQVIEILKELKQ